MTQFEQWRPIPGFEGIYAVSSEGRVLSLERFCESSSGLRRVRQRLLKQTGKPRKSVVKLSRPNGQSVCCTVARLVLTAFVGPPNDGQVAHYKDGDFSNANLQNVEWSTYSDICIKAGCTPPRKQKKECK